MRILQRPWDICACDECMLSVHVYVFVIVYVYVYVIVSTCPCLHVRVGMYRASSSVLFGILCMGVVRNCYDVCW